MLCNSTTGFVFCVYLTYSSPMSGLFFAVSEITQSVVLRAPGSLPLRSCSDAGGEKRVYRALWSTGSCKSGEQRRNSVEMWIRVE